MGKPNQSKFKRQLTNYGRRSIKLITAVVIALFVLFSAVGFLTIMNKPTGKLPQRSNAAKTYNSKTSTASNRTSATVVSNLLFEGNFAGPNRIITNEYAHWSHNSSCHYSSSDWDMTSGTLLAKNGLGYSGVPTLESSSVCDSSARTNSAIFRLNTMRSDFTNYTFSVDYLAIKHGGGGAPINSYDGIHLWVGYQSEYALYSATVFRWDHTLVLKKKLPVSESVCAVPANDGCYFTIGNGERHDLNSLQTANIWHHADIRFEVTDKGATRITEMVDGTLVSTALDDKLNGPNFTNGAVGIRGDNTEFYFKNFKVSRLL